MNPYLLGVVNRIIYDELPQQPSTYDEFSPLINELKRETDHFMRHLPMFLSMLKTHERGEVHIRAMQHDLLLMMEKVFSYLPGAQQRRLKQIADVPQCTDAYKVVYSYLDNAFGYIHRHCKRYIDIACTIPVSYLVEAQDKITESLALFEKRLDKSNVDQRCKEIALKPLYDLVTVNAAAHTVKYKELLYLNELHDGLTELFARYNDEEISQKLHELLIYLNFNDTHYFMHVTNLMMKDVEESHTSIFKRLRFCQLDNDNNALPVKPGTGYRPEEQCLKKQLKDWMAEQIDLIKSSAEILGAPVPASDLAAFENFEIFVDLSIDEFSYMVDLLYQVGIIKKDVPKKRVMELVTYFITTKGKGNKSAESARKKMYSPGPSIVNSVKEKLQEVIKKTDANILLLIPLAELIFQMAHQNANVIQATLALLFLALFTSLKNYFKNSSLWLSIS